MVLFIRSNQSWLGVNTIMCPEGITRNSYYMDYYVKPDDIHEVKENLKNMGYKKTLKWTYHQTTFIPFFPLGLKSFRTKGLKDAIYYVKSYFLYSIFKVSLITNLSFKYFDHIRSLKKWFIKQ